MRRLSALVVALVVSAIWWVVVFGFTVVVLQLFGAHEMGHVVGPDEVVTRFHPQTCRFTWGFFAVTMAVSFVNSARRRKVERWETTTGKSRDFIESHEDGDGGAAALHLLTYLPGFAVDTFLTIFEPDA